MGESQGIKLLLLSGFYYRPRGGCTRAVFSSNRVGKLPDDATCQTPLQRAKNRGEPKGKKSRSSHKRDRLLLAWKRWVDAYPRAKDHSKRYFDIHNDPFFKDTCTRLRKELDYHCAMCCGQFDAIKLEGHIRDYRRWREPGQIIILCADLCHPLVDAIRRWRLESQITTKNADDGDLFRTIDTRRDDDTLDLFQEMMGSHEELIVFPTLTTQD